MGHRLPGELGEEQHPEITRDAEVLGEVVAISVGRRAEDARRVLVARLRSHHRQARRDVVEQRQVLLLGVRREKHVVNVEPELGELKMMTRFLVLTPPSCWRSVARSFSWRRVVKCLRVVR